MAGPKSSTHFWTTSSLPADATTPGVVSERQAGRPAERGTPAFAPPRSSQEVQALWFACLRFEWNVLVLVPATPGASCLELARALADVGGSLRSSRPKAVSADGLDLGDVAQLVMEMSEPLAPGVEPTKTIIALDSVIQNPFSIAVALAADAAIICLHMGVTELSAANSTIEMIGREKFIGSVLLEGGK
jgi:hypothetical protein